MKKAEPQRAQDVARNLAQELAIEARRLDAAERVLEYAFRDRAPLLAALTHSSFVNEHATCVPHNEQLELIGDAVLSLVTVDALLAATPDSPEGDLTVRRAAFVSEEALAASRSARELGALMRTGRAAETLTPSLRADLIEALLGAVYRDGGLEAARAATARLLGAPPLEARPTGERNAKTLLQERLQGLFGEAPRYDVERGEGPNHAPSFRARCMFRAVAIGEGVGSTKQGATEAAARDALVHLGPDAAVRARFADTRR